MLRCEKCTFHKGSCQGFIFTNFTEGVGNPNAKVMLVYDSIFAADVTADHMATDDQYNSQMTQYLNRIGLTLDDLYITTFIKCFISDKKKKPTKLMKDKCVSEYLRAEIQKVKPKVILLCGSMVTKHFLPESKTVGQVIGQAFYNNEYKCYIIPIFDLFYLANFTKQSIQVRKMERALARVKVLVSGNGIAKQDQRLVYFSDWNKLAQLKQIVTCDLETTGLDSQKDRVITIGVGDNQTRVVFDISDSTGYAQIAPLIEEIKTARAANIATEKENDRIRKERKEKKSKETYLKLSYAPEYLEERLDKIRDIAGKTFSKQFLPKIAEELNKRKVIYQNGLFDLKMFLREGYDVTESMAGDTRLLQYLIDPLGANALGFMVQLYYGVNYKETIDRGNLIEMEPNERKYYNNEDLYYTYNLFNDLFARVKKQGSELAHAVKVNLTKILAHTEHRGIQIDLKKADELIQFYTEQRDQAAKKFKDKFNLPAEFNLNSPKQLCKFLYDDLGLPIGIKTKEGNPSTNEDAIKVLYNKKPSLQSLIDYRTFKGNIEKLTLYKESTRVDGRLRTEFNMFSQDSARLMSRKPNIQNVTRQPLKGIADKDVEAFKEKYGYKPDLKAIFVAAPGYSFIYDDYSQIEFRVWIELANDPKGIEFITSGRDIHAYIASQFYREPEATFLDKKNLEAREKRNKVKTIVYGSMYGRTPEGIVREHGGTVEEAEQIQKIFFNICRTGYLWMKQVEQKVLKEHQLFTPFGAHRVFQDVELATGRKQEELLREAKSYIVQSWAVELVFIGMYKVWQKIRALNLDAYCVHQIHDATIFEVKDEHVEKVKEIINTCARNPYGKMKLPLDVEMKVGKSWSEVA